MFQALKSLSSRRFWQRAISVLTVVLVFNVIVEDDWFRSAFPFVQSSQLWFHRVLCSLVPRPINAKWVRVVAIDDDLHQQLGEPTDRKFLARLIRNAAAGQATAIVLDFKFVVPPGNKAGEDAPEREDGNIELLNAIQGALDRDIPVVLPCWLKVGPKFSERIPDIFLDRTLPLPDQNGLCRNATCARVGNINLAEDRRQIPLVTPTRRPDEPCSESIALAAASSYEDAVSLNRQTRDKDVIRNAIKKRKPVFGSFIPESGFPPVSARCLADKDSAAEKLCRGRIVIIGGTWQADLGRGERVDSHDTPAGKMYGIFLHANYIEALLDDRYQQEVPLWFSTLFDLVAGGFLYWSFHSAATLRGKLMVMGVFLVPLLASYVLFANLNYYLDFILIFIGCFVHLVVELGREYIRLRRSSGVNAEGHAGGQPA